MKKHSVHNNGKSTNLLKGAGHFAVTNVCVVVIFSGNFSDLVKTYVQLFTRGRTARKADRAP